MNAHTKHRFPVSRKVIVTKGERTELATVVTLNPSGSYGVRLESGAIVEAGPDQVGAFFETDRKVSA